MEPSPKHIALRARKVDLVNNRQLELISHSPIGHTLNQQGVGLGAAGRVVRGRAIGAALWREARPHHNQIPAQITAAARVKGGLEQHRLVNRHLRRLVHCHVSLIARKRIFQCDLLDHCAALPDRSGLLVALGHVNGVGDVGWDFCGVWGTWCELEDFGWVCVE